MKNILLTILFSTALLFTVGCEDKNKQDPAVVVLPSGEEVAVNMEDISPKSSVYEGEGIKFHRKVDSVRFLDISGVSPGEVISRQNPAQINTGAAPAINITPDGVGAEATKKGTEFTGGSGKWSFLGTIWQRIKDFFKVALPVIIIGGLAFLILPVLFPALAPIFATITAGIKKFITWLLPFFGGLIEWIKGIFTKKVVTNQAKAMFNFENQVANDARIPEDVKAYVLSMLNNANDVAHDSETKEYVNQIKATFK